jgi:hypothetical protein
LRLDFVVVVVPSNEVKGNREIFSKEWVEQRWIVFAFPDFRIKRIAEDVPLAGMAICWRLWYE